jgi:hypothetical protein
MMDHLLICHMTEQPLTTQQTEWIDTARESILYAREQLIMLAVSLKGKQASG